MTEVLQNILNVSILVFVVTCMLAVGLTVKVREILDPLRNYRLVLLALAANFVLSPAAAYLLTKVIPLNQAHATGLLLLGGAAGAPFLPKLAEFAGGDLAFSVALMLLLMIGSAFFMPLALPLLIPGLSADAWQLAKPLLVTMLVPLAAGFGIKSRSEWFSSRLLPVVSKVSNVSLVLVVVLLIGLNLKDLYGTLGSGAVGASLLFVALSFAIGYALSPRAPGTRSVLALGTGQRNVAAALVTATGSFTDPGVAVMILVATLAGLVLLLIAAAALRGRRPAADET